MNAILFPQIDNIAIRIFDFAIYWYSIAYIFGFIFGYILLLRLDRQNRNFLTNKSAEDLLFFSVLFVILGGRLGYCFFYEFPKIIENPLKIFAIRSGGMSFHGGLIGMAIAIYFVSRKHKIPFFALTDLICCVAPLGILFGRIANFVNAELYGRITDVPWAVIFPNGGVLPRHPSQIYEAITEGLILLVVMLLCFKRFKTRALDGYLSGVFAMFYGIFRVLCEHFREPDIQLGFIYKFFTMGQILCIPMILIGMFLVIKKSGKGF